MKAQIFAFSLAMASSISAFASNINCSATQGNSVYTISVVGDTATISSYNRLTAMRPIVVGTYSGVQELAQGKLIVRKSADGKFNLTSAPKLTATLNKTINLEKITLTETDSDLKCEAL